MHPQEHNSSSVLSEISVDDEIGKLYEMMDFDANIMDANSEDERSGRYGGEVERTALGIERFVMLVCRTNEDAFEIKETRSGVEKVKKKRIGYRMNMFDNFISLRLLDYEFSENVNIFFRACEALGLNQGTFISASCSDGKVDETSRAKIFNSLVQRIRMEADSKETRRRFASRKYSSTRNYKSCKLYSDKAFHRYARLLILRIDFGYHLTQGDSISLEKCQNDMARFNNNRRWNLLFDNVVGYISKLEYGERKGYHYHMLFFCDGSKVKNHSFLAEKIGRY